MSKRNRQGAREISLLGLEKLLIHVLNNPKQYLDNELLKSSLSSQGKLSSLDYLFSDGHAEYAIKPMSLNSMKTHSQLLFESGYARINDLRIAATRSLEDARAISQQPNKRTRNGLNLTINELESKLDMYQRSVVILLQAINSCMHSLKVVNKTVEANLRDKRTQDAISEIQSVMALSPISANERQHNDSSVANMEDYRNGS